MFIKTILRYLCFIYFNFDAGYFFVKSLKYFFHSHVMFSANTHSFIATKMLKSVSIITFLKCFYNLRREFTSDMVLMTLGKILSFSSFMFVFVYSTLIILPSMFTFELATEIFIFLSLYVYLHNRLQ